MTPLTMFWAFVHAEREPHEKPTTLRRSRPVGYVSLCQVFSKTPSSGHPDPCQTGDATRVHREACNKPHEARVHIHGRFAGFRAVRCVVLCEPA
eukprot:2489072-Prymnesium_polylepis.1